MDEILPVSQHPLKETYIPNRIGMINFNIREKPNQKEPQTYESYHLLLFAVKYIY